MVTRPIIHHGGVDFEDIVAVSRHHGTLLQLRPLSEEASATYLKRYLQVADLYALPSLLVKYINDMAAGNPKHIEELAAQLKTCGYLSLEKGRVVLHRDDLYTLPIPPKMSGYIMNMIDRFQIRHQLIVKIASTCDYFTEAILNEIIPYREDAHLLPNVINDLVESGIFLPLYPPNIPENVMSWDPNTKVCYTFASKLLQRQANDLLLHSDREKLEQHRNKVRRSTIFFSTATEEYAFFFSAALFLCLSQGILHHFSIASSLASPILFTLTCPGHPGSRCAEYYSPAEQDAGVDSLRAPAYPAQFAPAAGDDGGRI